MNLLTPQEISVPGENWFHPAAAQLSPSLLILTAQKIQGMDCYADPVFFLSRDKGKSWENAEKIPPFLSRKLGHGLEEGVADIRPFPLPDGECIFFGCTSFYTAAGNISWNPLKEAVSLPPRKAVYAIRHRDGSWSPRGELAAPRETSDCRATCVQIVCLPGDELLIPLHFEAGRCQLGKRTASRFACAAVRVRRRGDTLECPEFGNILTHEVKRGFIEPSVIRLPDGKFALTLRAEDGCGYCSVSDDGLNWPAPRPWQWEDGTLLEMSSTQQHWFTLGEKVYLVYTRRDESNENVFRYRSPLRFAEADVRNAALCRSTETILFPREMYRGEEVLYGNFHAANFSSDLAVITDAALAPETKKTRLRLAEVFK